MVQMNNLTPDKLNVIFVRIMIIRSIKRNSMNSSTLEMNVCWIADMKLLLMQ